CVELFSFAYLTENLCEDSSRRSFCQGLPDVSCLLFPEVMALAPSRVAVAVVYDIGLQNCIRPVVALCHARQFYFEAEPESRQTESIHYILPLACRKCVNRFQPRLRQRARSADGYDIRDAAAQRFFLLVNRNARDA